MKQTLRILIVYKQSFLSAAGRLSKKLNKTHNFVSHHLKHNETLKHVENSLTSLGLSYNKIKRKPDTDYSKYGLIIAIGGDGTFLEVARGIDRHQLLLGVNSDPGWSVGKFCHAQKGNFNEIIKSIVNHSADIKPLYKLRMLLQSGPQNRMYECLNDILICHANPAAMSRYRISIGDIQEEHRNSGIWISSAAGSTGAILSAGGCQIPEESRIIQYKPRELYHIKGSQYRLTGGLVGVSEKITILSLMGDGRVFLDGSHVSHKFEYERRAVITSSPNFIRVVNGP